MYFRFLLSEPLKMTCNNTQHINTPRHCKINTVHGWFVDQTVTESILHTLLTSLRNEVSMLRLSYSVASMAIVFWHKGRTMASGCIPAVDISILFLALLPQTDRNKHTAHQSENNSNVQKHHCFSFNA